MNKKILKILKDIKNLKIQSAENIAKKAIECFKFFDYNKKNIFKELEKFKLKLFKTRPTEPMMRNVVNYILKDIKQIKHEDLEKIIIKRTNKILNFILDSEKKISIYGSKLIKNGMIIFTHCHSSTVNSILKEAAKTKNFIVYNTETRPLMQGRITARELSKAGINVKHFVDSAAKLAIKESDLMLLGCDAILSDATFINKIGSDMFAMIAEKYDVPFYIATNSLKFDPLTIIFGEEKIELRKSSEVWKNPPKNVIIVNPAFEKIHPRHITAVISELGILEPSYFLEELRLNYPWLFNL